jgi:D-sedoheptulose 7-phosphate isomerase
MKINHIIEQSIKVKKQILEDGELIQTIQTVTDSIVNCYKNDGKVLFCGNGGSAADAQHLAAELSGKFYFDREPLNSEALHVNTSYLTAVGNDYSYQEIYSRIVKAKGRKGDILVAISTSGNSQNVLNAMIQAKEQGMQIVGLSGKTGGKMKELCDFLIPVPCEDTPRIQEAHILIGHIICQLVEEDLFPQNK